jgi:glyoxylase-like metal-dependent hydrolase (beta-lactamase superfamily II)
MSGPLVHCMTNGVFQENCYLLADPDTREAVLVDPGEEENLFLDRLETEGLTLRAVWLTHAHIDHVLGVSTVVERTGVPVFLHAADRPLYERVADQAEAFGVSARALPPPDEDLALVEEVVVGDLIFLGSVGRTDLPGGDTETLLRSIQDHVLTLPDETVLHSGHGPETTVGRERRGNPFLTGQFRLV